MKTEQEVRNEIADELERQARRFAERADAASQRDAEERKARGEAFVSDSHDFVRDHSISMFAWNFAQMVRVADKEVHAGPPSD